MPHGISGNFFPYTIRHILRRHFIVTYHMIIRHRYLRKLLHQTFDRCLLIRLPSAEIDISHEYVAYHLFIHFHQKRSSGLLRRQHDVPFPRPVGFCIIRCISETHRDFLTRIRPPPNFQLGFPLKHHPVAHQFRQPDRRPSFAASYQTGEEQKHRTHFF